MGTCEGFDSDAIGLPPEVFPYLADRVSATRAANGSTVKVNLKGVPDEDRMGRIIYVAGAVIEGDGQVDTNATTMTSTYSGYNQLGAYSNIVLRDRDGWQYFEGVDGRNLRDDTLFRHGTLILGDPAALADATNTDSSNAIDLATIWARVDRERRVMRDGLIPVKDLKSGNATFEFDIVSDLPGSPAGVTWDGFVGGLNIWLLLVAKDEAISDGKWELREHTADELNGALPFAERLTEYAAIRHTPQDTGAQDNSDYDSLQVEVGGLAIKSAFSDQETAFANALMHSLDPLHVDAADIDYGTTPEVTFLVEAAANKAAMAHGVVSYRFTRGTHTTTRFLIRRWREHRRDERVARLRRLGLGQATIKAGAAADNAGKGPSRRLASFLPRVAQVKR